MLREEKKHGLGYDSFPLTMKMIIF